MAAPYGILKKLSMVTTPRHLRELIGEYLDQRTKRDAVTVEDAMSIAGSGARYDDMLLGKRAPQRPGEDFIESVQGRPVRLGGFLASELKAARPRNQPAALETDLSIIAGIWHSQTKTVKNKAYHLVFSIEPKAQKEFLDLRIPVGEILFGAATGSLNEYSRWLYPGESLSHIMGYHSDRPNSHLHILLFPFTNERRRLNLSRNAEVKDLTGRRSVRLDSQKKLHDGYLGNLGAFHRAIHAGVPRQSMDPEIAFIRTSLLSGVHVELMSAQRAKLPGNTLDHDFTVTSKAAVNQLNDPAQHSRTLQIAEMSFREVDAEVSSPDKKLAFLKGLRKQIEADILSYRGRTDAISSSRKRLIASHVKWQESPDRVMDRRMLFSPGYMSEIDAVTDSKHPLSDLLADDNEYARITFRRERILRAKAQREALAAAQSAVYVNFDWSRASSVAREARIGHYGARVAEVAAIAKGRKPAHLTARPAAVIGNDFLSSPDHGKQRIDLHVKAERDRMLSRHKPFNPDRDAVDYKGVSDKASDDDVLIEYRGDILAPASTIEPEVDAPLAPPATTRESVESEVARLLSPMGPSLARRASVAHRPSMFGRQ